LHEECQQRIVHYDIKPANILLDANFFPKVADFGLAKLCNRDKTHITMTGMKGTPGYAAPEVWMRLHITHKCDVYSFGMLLFEIIGRRRNLDLNLTESQDWFPRWGWNKFEAGELGEVMLVCGIEEKDREAAERMVKVAMWCVQYRPELRPLMSVVVKMLEGEIEIPRPSINPFQHLMPDTPIMAAYSTGDFDTDSSQTITGYSVVHATPIMKKFEIEIASTA
jgi:serine/threonine protein kinase